MNYMKYLDYDLKKKKKKSISLVISSETTCKPYSMDLTGFLRCQVDNEVTFLKRIRHIHWFLIFVTKSICQYDTFTIVTLFYM